MINQRISSLRLLMKENDITAYIVPSEDFHQSEYVGEYFKARAFISGFTGSAGLVIVTAESALLWTDGRYFIQAEKQLQGSDITLQKMDEPGVPTPIDYLKRTLPHGCKIAFDGRVVSVDDGLEYAKIVAEKNGTLLFDVDLIDQIWNDRPYLSEEPAFYLPEQHSGESSLSKLSRVQEKMSELGANLHIVSALDDICWMFNLRGNDVRYSPLVLSYAVITLEDVHLFIDKNKLSHDILQSFEKINVNIHPYNDIYDFVKSLDPGQKILLDPGKLNYALYQNIPSDALRVESPNPSILMKAVKNETELDNIRQAHIKDGIAWVRFMYWLKQNINKMDISEISASDQLETFRKEQEDYLWPSFAPISAYQGNAAIIHYESTPETNRRLMPRGLYLSDTGGNYMQGSTDITRTIALGPLSSQERLHFTTVLKSHINLAMARFLEGCSGYALDILARKPMWDMGLDYKHGTGHGVGYLLNIHEGPSGIRYKILSNRREHHPLQAGMVITNEPGIYIQDRHGVRIENEMIVIKGKQTEYGQFLEFEPCTYVPIDLDGIDTTLLSTKEKTYLNQYHQMVYATISPFLPESERDWLSKYTKKI